MTIPAVYRKTGEGAIASYNFTDLVTKTGYLTLYAVAGIDGVISLTPVVIESSTLYYKTTDDSDDGAVAEKELDIDIEFKVPQSIKGKAIVALSYFADNGNGVATTDCFTKVRVYHYDGSTETEIGTQQTTRTITAASGSAVKTYTRETVIFDIAKTHFKIGDKLRLNIELWGTIGANGVIGVYHDSKNRDIQSTT